MQAAIGAVLGLPCLTTSPAPIHPKRIETSSEAEYAFGLCNILWQRVPEFNYALCMKKKNNTSFGLFQTCCSFISELQTFLPALAACPSLELLLPRIRKESFFANKPAPAPLPRKKLWLRGKSLAQQISLLIDNGASVLPTQREKK